MLGGSLRRSSSRRSKDEDARERPLIIVTLHAFTQPALGISSRVKMTCDDFYKDNVRAQGHWGFQCHCFVPPCNDFDPDKIVYVRTSPIPPRDQNSRDIWNQYIEICTYISCKLALLIISDSFGVPFGVHLLLRTTKVCTTTTTPCFVHPPHS